MSNQNIIGYLRKGSKDPSVCVTPEELYTEFLHRCAELNVDGGFPDLELFMTYLEGLHKNGEIAVVMRRKYLDN